ncbi:MAG: phosphate ABC transporter substrate-binding protein PstS [Gammaproteobacteria bacterium]
MKNSAFVKTAFVSVLLIAAAISSAPVSAENMRLIGSGASFPFPIYSTWFKQYSGAREGVIVDYQAKGSGAGIQDFINGTVDFAASDAAMSDEEIAKVGKGVVLLPMTAGEIVLAYHLPGDPKGLKLPRDVYPDILLGKITQWNDPRIAQANPDLSLPDMPITVVSRADSSGTTYVFTRHLSAVSEDWKNGPGTGKTVQWPRSDKLVAAPKNDGITATVKQTPGAIGYIEYSYAKLTKTSTALLQNKAGNFVAVGGETGKAALAGAQLSEDLRMWVDDPDGANSYPIASFTWMLFSKKQDPKKAEALRDVVEYCLTEGQKIADQMGYIPLPENVVEKVRVASQQIQ